MIVQKAKDKQKKNLSGIKKRSQESSKPPLPERQG
jgi:hypothetical protein